MTDAGSAGVGAEPDGSLDWSIATASTGMIVAPHGVPDGAAMPHSPVDLAGIDADVPQHFGPEIPHGDGVLPSLPRPVKRPQSRGDARPGGGQEPRPFSCLRRAPGRAPAL